MKILVTGANGLVGRMLCSVLDQTGDRAIRSVRVSNSRREIPVGDVDENTNWNRILDSGIDAVVHLAGKVPVADRETDIVVAQYRQVNTFGTANLARQCATKGVKRFVFVSTVKVLGEGRDEPYRSNDPALPGDAYAISKWEAEQSLRQIAIETGMEVVILRPPLVYGQGVKGNFLRLLRAVDRRRPLPLGAIQNRRSLIYLGNLVDVIRLCLTHRAAANKTFMVSDGDDVSSPELIGLIAEALRRDTLLLPVPVKWMRWAGRLLGKQAMIDRLVGSLAVDISPIQKELCWKPPYTVRSGLAVTAAWYREVKADNAART